MDNYVYVYCDPRKNGGYKYCDYEFECEPFYVGRGIKDRCGDHLQEAILHEKPRGNIVKFNIIKEILNENSNPIIKFVANEISLEESLFLEMCMIKIIGRQDKNEGPLTNLTDGSRMKTGYKNILSLVSKYYFEERERDYI